MELYELHQADKPVSAVPLFTGQEGKVLALQIKADEHLKEHVTKVPALLLCVSGSATFANVDGESHNLSPGKYVNIVPHVVHWVDAHTDSQFVLMK
jgi:quercetin dioxygenase-like cupin family protein